MQREFRIIDVFTEQPYLGNPVAVVLHADGLRDDQMQRIAAWTNLSETTFHLRPTVPEAHYRLRIFTPRGELPFAGHPTLGSAHALIEAGAISAIGGRVVQECAAGLVPVAVGHGVLQLEQPEASLRDLTDAEHARLTAIIGTEPFSRAALVDLGARWIVAEVADVNTLAPDLGASALFETDLAATGVTLFANGPAGVEVRSFAPSCGVDEDPVCGSGNGAVAVFRLARGQISEGADYTAAQGKCVGRDGRVFVGIRGGVVHVGGHAVTTVSGTITT